MASSTTAMSPAASRSPTLTGMLTTLPGIGAKNLVALLLVGSFLHVQILGLRVYNVYVEGTLEHADVIALAALAAHKACVERVSVVQDGATSVLCHHNVHFVGAFRQW